MWRPYREKDTRMRKGERSRGSTIAMQDHASAKDYWLIERHGNRSTVFSGPLFFMTDPKRMSLESTTEGGGL